MIFVIFTLTCYFHFDLLFSLWLVIFTLTCYFHFDLLLCFVLLFLLRPAIVLLEYVIVSYCCFCFDLLLFYWNMLLCFVLLFLLWLIVVFIWVLFVFWTCAFVLLEYVIVFWACAFALTCYCFYWNMLLCFTWLFLFWIAIVLLECVIVLLCFIWLFCFDLLLFYWSVLLFYWNMLLCFARLFLLWFVTVLFKYVIVFWVCVFCFIEVCYCLLNLCFCFDLLLFYWNMLLCSESVLLLLCGQCRWDFYLEFCLILCYCFERYACVLFVILCFSLLKYLLTFYLCSIYIYILWFVFSAFHFNVLFVLKDMFVCCLLFCVLVCQSIYRLSTCSQYILWLFFLLFLMWYLLWLFGLSFNLYFRFDICFSSWIIICAICFIIRFFAKYYYIMWICLHCCCFGFSVVFIFSIWNAYFLVWSEFLCSAEFLSCIIFCSSKLWPYNL